MADNDIFPDFSGLPDEPHEPINKDFSGLADNNGALNNTVNNGVGNGSANNFNGNGAAGNNVPQSTTGNTNTEDVDYEKLSYSKLSYKRVQRLRRRAKRRGVEVPKLEYPLTKPDKPRILFWIMAIISAILYLGIVVGVGYLADALITSINGSGLGEFIKNITKPEFVLLSLGIPTTVSLIFIIIIYSLIVLLLLAAVLFVIYAFRFVRESFYMATCSKEEFAKGSIITGRILRYTVIIVLVTVLLIVGLVRGPSDDVIVKVISGVLYGVLLLVLGGPLLLMVLERRKCKKWFEAQPEEKKRNYIEHDRGLSGAKDHTFIFGNRPRPPFGF